MRFKLSFLLAAMAIGGVVSAQAQIQRLFEIPVRAEIYNYKYVAPDTIDSDSLMVDMRFFDDAEPDDDFDDDVETVMNVWPEYEDVSYLPDYSFHRVVFDKLHLMDSLKLANVQVTPDPTNSGAYRWLDEYAFKADLMKRARQYFVVNSPQYVLYNEATLPEPPRKFIATVDPETAKIVLAEAPVELKEKEKLEVDFEKKHWLKTFTGAIQFSQAYVSPNWYQGGNDNLNMLANIYYNVKLNPAFHPTFLFETTIQYKLGMNNAPDDEVHDYNISDDIFQFNMLLGYKASKRWYYSTNVSFKTQLLNNFKANSHDLKSAFLSPGELNVGLGMTYNYVNPKKTLTFDASISPLSWNMKTCISHRMDETAFGIKAGRNTVHEIGSSAEGKLSWNICDNINLRSRLFVFSDYSYIQSDWENTISFAINRFLSTQIYVHMRYDSSTPAVEDSDWHKFQLKEILSFGFSYKFSTI